MVRSTVLSTFKRSSNNALRGARETYIRPAKPILWPFAKNKNLIELEVFFLEIVHPDLYSGKVWGFPIFSFCIPPGEILGWLLLKVLINPRFRSPFQVTDCISLRSKRFSGVREQRIAARSPVPELSFLPALYGGWTLAGERRVQDNLHADAQSEPIKNYEVPTTPLASMCLAMPFSARALKENIFFDVDIVVKNIKA